MKGKPEYGGGWICFKRRGGCGAKFADDDASIIGQQKQIPNDREQKDWEATLEEAANKGTRALSAAWKAMGAFWQNRYPENTI